MQKRNFTKRQRVCLGGVGNLGPTRLRVVLMCCHDAESLAGHNGKRYPYLKTIKRAKKMVILPTSLLLPLPTPLTLFVQTTDSESGGSGSGGIHHERNEAHEMSYWMVNQFNAETRRKE